LRDIPLTSHFGNSASFVGVYSSEVLTRKRPLTLPMVRQLSALLNISTDVLVQAYETRSAA